MTDSAPGAGLGQRIAAGAVWTISFRMVDRLIGVASTLILARLLAPADFGVVAMATTLIALLEIVTVGEFGSAIIQNPTATRDHYDSAWTLSFLFGIAAALLMILVAKPTAAFFDEPRLVPVIWALSAVPIIEGLYNMGCIDFRKYLQFERDFVYQVGRKIIGFAIVVPLAFAFRSYWALIGGMLAGRLGGTLLSYALHPFRPRFSLKSAGSLYRFSRWIMLNNALTFLSTRGAHLVIGRIAGPQSLGIYTVSHEMANLPTTELAVPINRAVFPGYAKLRDDRTAMQQGFLRVIGLIATVALPAGLGMASVSHLFVPTVLGNKWLAAAPLISILAIGGGIHVLQANIESLYYSLGLPKLRALVTLLEIAVFLPLVLILLKKFGLPGVGFAFLATTLFIVPVNFKIALRLLALSPRDLLDVIWRPIVAALTMAGVVIYFFPPGPQAGDTWITGKALAEGVALGATTYAAALFALWATAGRPPGAELWILSQASELVRRLRARIGPPD
jgi:O-antigen/teichoic acid export membrane protein